MAQWAALLTAVFDSSPHSFEEKNWANAIKLP
jgi:hypothetical protein